MSQPLPASKKSRALLAYLVATGDPHSRSRLCELFWEGPVDPKAELRWSLAKLRPLVDDEGASRLLADRERVAFAPGGARVDLAEVQVLAPASMAGAGDPDTARLAAAAAAFRGEFLEGLELADCYRFDQWLVAERERWRRLRASILEALCVRLADAPRERLAHSRAWAMLDPLDERAHGAVIRSLLALGRAREAAAQYETARRILRQELGVRPGALLEAARLASPPARADRGAEAATEPSPMVEARAGQSVPSALQPPFLAREGELARLEELRNRAGAPGARPLALLVGEPGIGKSRLLAEFARIATAAGSPVVSGRAYEAELMRPYGLWIDALRATILPPLDDGLREDLAAILPELGRPRSDAAERVRLFDAVARLLAQISSSAGGAVVVVLLDNLQWLDESSVALLHYLTRTPLAGPVMLVAAARPVELAANAAATSLMYSLEGSQQSVPVAVAAFDLAATRQLVAAVSPALAAGPIFVESEGNPLFALELARSRAHGGDPFPESLAALLRQRLGGLEDVGSRLVPWAAALGRSFDSEILQHASGMSSGDIVAGLDDLERHGVVKAATGGAYDFTHDLVRRAAYRGVTEPRRRLIHGRIAGALASRDDPDGAVAGEIAHHAALGGDSRLAAASYLVAGERSLRIAAVAEARAVAEAGIQHLTNLARPVALPLHVGLLSVFVRSSLGRARADELHVELQGLATEARAAGLHPAVQTTLYLLATLDDERGNSAGAAQQVMRAAEEARHADSATAARALSNAGRCLVQIDLDHAAAERLLLEAGELAHEAAVEVIDISWGLGLLHHHAGRLEAAAHALGEAVDLARRNADHWSHAQCLLRLAMVELETGDRAAAIARCEEARVVAQKLGDSSEGAVAAALTALARRPDRPGGGDAALEATLVALRQLDSKGPLAYALNLAALQDLEAQSLATAVQRVSEALELASALGRASEIACARATIGRLAVAAGDHVAAASEFALLTAEAADAANLSARARAQIAALATALGAHLPTLRPTIPPTPQR